MALHMIKLVVGCDTVDDLRAWHARARPGQPWTMHTRQTPKRAAELVDGGSLYRVFKGVVLCRQRILAVETVGEGPASRCVVTVDPDCVPVAPTPRRAFQGDHYDVPEDLYDVAVAAGAQPVGARRHAFAAQHIGALLLAGKQLADSSFRHRRRRRNGGRRGNNRFHTKRATG